MAIDSDILHLTALAAASTDDMMYIVDDPGGSPSDRSITVEALFTNRTHAGKLSLAPGSNTIALQISGFLDTGNHRMVTAAVEWNTASAPRLIGIDVTDTASDAAAELLGFSVNGLDALALRKDGLLSLGGALSLIGGLTADVFARVPDVGTDAIAGQSLKLAASDAIAGDTNAGAAAGGSVTITAGDARRLTSGDADGGGFTFNPGSGIGTGVKGTMQINGATAIASPNDVAGLAISAGSITGSGATSFFTLSGTFNTSGSPFAVAWDIDDTASGANMRFFSIRSSAGSDRFYVAKGGVVGIKNSAGVELQMFGSASTRFALGTTSNHPISIFTNNGNYDFSFYANILKGRTGSQFGFSTSSSDSSSGTGPTWSQGAGSPEGVVTAAVGSIYSRNDGGATTSFYVKESGAGNTGWIAK